MQEASILLGYQVPSGEPVHVPLAHLVVTGITQRSGKSTTINALAIRSGRRVLAFATKPGENAFDGPPDPNIVHVYVTQNSNWQYVESLLQATMGERMRIERSFIITATKGAKTLYDVDENIQEMLRTSRRGFDTSILTNIHAYFEIVLPQIRKITKDGQALEFPTLKNGINVMDITKLKSEVQSLIIRSCLEHIIQNEQEIIVVIPELWKFCPEKRGNPVKSALSQLIRQGAVKGNYVWADSQDLASVSKEILKQVSIWCLGLQQEVNEVEHTLDQIPLPRKEKPQTEQIMRLKLGHFYLVTPTNVQHIYVQPAWMETEQAKAIATGQSSPDQKRRVITRSPIGYAIETALGIAHERGPQVVAVPAQIDERLEAVIKEPRDIENHIRDEFDKIRSRQPVNDPDVKIEADDIVVQITHREYPRKFSTDTALGKVMYVTCNDLHGGPASEVDISKELTEHGWNMKKNTLAPTLGNLVKNGDLVKESGRPSRWRTPKKVKLMFAESD